MQDPEQKTDFYNKADQKITGFSGSSGEGQLYTGRIQRIFINYENLKTLVNQLGNRLGMGAGRTREPGGEESAANRPARLQRRRRRKKASGSRSVFCSHG